MTEKNVGLDYVSVQDSNLELEDCIVFDRNGNALRINHDLTAKWAIQNNYVAHLVERGRILVYKNGVYEDYGEEQLRKQLFDAFGIYSKPTGQSLITRNDINEVIARVQTSSQTSISEFEINKPLFNVSNGILNLETRELLPHSPTWKFLTKSPVYYDPDAQCPRFIEFVDQSLESEYKQLMGEIIGYTMWHEYHIHKAFMFYGPKRTGKGTMMRVIEALIGDRDCSHVSLQDLAGNRFARARLFGKKLNSSGDLPATPIADAGIFKNLTGQDTIDAENKFEQIFSFKNKAKLIFSANELPRLKRDDEAFYGRWIIVPFNNSVYDKEDVNLTAKLTTSEELSGILNFGLEGLNRLKENGWKFSYKDDAASLYRRKSNPIVAFLEDRCKPSDGYIVKAELATAYNEYARQHGLVQITSKITFGKAIKDQVIIPIETVYPSVNGKQVEAWGGIAFKN